MRELDIEELRALVEMLHLTPLDVPGDGMTVQAEGKTYFVRFDLEGVLRGSELL